MKQSEFGIVTKGLAGLCHNCGICTYANKKPGSSFERLMR